MPATAFLLLVVACIVVVRCESPTDGAHGLGLLQTTGGITPPASPTLAACGMNPCYLDAAVAALLAQKERITNWDAFAMTHMMNGWANNDTANVCQWSGVACRADQIVTL